jgi:hypothetical protein
MRHTVTAGLICAGLSVVLVLILVGVLIGVVVAR